MNVNLDSLTELTEFAPLSPEPDNTGIKSFFSSFFSKASSPGPEAPRNGGDTTTSPNNAAAMPHILRKVGNFLPGKSSTLQSYKDSDMKQYWMPDAVSKECYLCGDKFTTFRRRHHCRICGQIFCSKCCNQEIPGKALGYSGDLRVCTYCCKQVLTYLNSTDTTQSAELKALQEDLEIKYGSGGNQDVFPSGGSEGPSAQQLASERAQVTLSRKISVGYQEEKFASPRLTSDKTRKSIFLNLYDELIMTLPCPFPGTVLIQWCFDHNKATTRAQAEMIAQALFDSEYIKCISGPGSGAGDSKFSLDALYTIVCQDEEESSPADPLRIHSSNSTSSFHLDLNLEDSTASIRPNKNSATRTTREISENPNLLPVHSLQKIIQAYRRDPIRPNNAKADAALTDKFESHRNKLLQQLLIVESLSMSWASVILPLAEKIIEEVKPDQNIDSFDIRQYVQIKKVDGGTRNDSFVVSGIVHSKNVSHKSMLTALNNPKILILQCAIVYQRVEGKLLSLEPVIMQETEYLRNVVARISALKPDIVLVQRNVARLAQESLQQLGITLVLNVKTTVLERIARCTRADLVYSVDVLLNQIHLGTCSRFSVKKLSDSNKTLMFFEGCAFPHKGSTVILRGASRKELMKVKRVTSFMIYVLYNWKLESSLLMDEQAYVIQTKKPILQSPSDSVADIISKPSTDEKHTRSNSESTGDVKVAIQKPASQSIQDASDPLQSEPNVTSPMSPQDLHLAVDNVPTNSFRKALDDIILSVSPTIKYTVPYLENETGKKCDLRKYFPDNIYWSAQLDPAAPIVKNETPVETIPRHTLELKEPHAFLSEVLTETCDSAKVRSSLALYRAAGGRLTPSSKKLSPPPTVTPPAPVSTKIDALQPSNHQRLPVLIYICRSPIHSPGFCVEPCTINMDFYARNDIPLGSFLEKYCFRRDYKCPSATCLIPTLEHERWFIHGNGSVCVGLCEIENRPPEAYDERIIMWNWCPSCKQVSSILPMSSDTWRLSLAKFLDLRFNCVPLGCKTASCTHHLHQEQVHYFAYNNIVASFIYTRIKLYEVCIPSTTLKKSLSTFDKNGLFEEVKKWSLMGQEVFSIVLEKLHTNQTDATMNTLQPLLVKDQANLKQKVDDIQMKLTDPDVMNNLWNLEDSIVKLKRAVVESINNWNSRLMKTRPKTKSTDSSKSLLTDIVEGTPTTETSTEYVFDSEESEESDVDHVDDSDTVKTKVPRMKAILSQLLPTNVPSLPISNSLVEAQQHHTLALGCSVPVVVYEQEPSSIISYALSSFDYQYKLEELKAAHEIETNECKIPHIDIKFSDTAANFSVKMYFADLFAELRKFSCPEGEESFIRSLSRCIRWEARGGKSGSNFCKTKDDRFILKEMSRLEMDSFLTFAPNYYNYVKNCFENSSPTLLCKIFGVFRVICQNNNSKTRSNLLVMENLFHSRNIKLRFDLKGSLRNRLVDTSLDSMDSDAVLLDENFINMISESPLYIHPHSKFILMQAINNDTQFLANQHVMDYSLLLGIDDTNMELVVGMIDYIRTFTWDKKIETMVKKSGLLGGQGKLPTIVSPDEYRKRFQSAMNRYFLGVPDRWSGLVEGINI
ncbi:hypothetical protein M8J77_005179 [Diaphorina citri]|nr:hypothetical protein M8J77_005179 [Diaphorina citri]